jgi:hypothetical protein
MTWLLLALAVVVVAALLLIWILLEARAISGQAARALAAAANVETNTQALWAIPQVNQLLAAGGQTAAAIAGKAERVADSLPPKGGRAR